MSAPCPVFGFAVEFTLHAELPGAVNDTLATAFEVEVLDARGLVGERASCDRLSFIVRSEASQATDADVRAVEAWAAARPGIIHARVGPIVDLSADAVNPFR
jgi:uncharacterized protein YggL (DUF469 family)